MKNTLNEKQIAILNILNAATEFMTLAEISAQVGFDVKSGTTNSLVKKGYMAIAGIREIVCPCCGRKTKVKEYTIGEKSPEADVK